MSLPFLCTWYEAKLTYHEQVKKLDHVAYALLQHVPERIGTVSAED